MNVNKEMKSVLKEMASRTMESLEQTVSKLLTTSIAFVADDRKAGSKQMHWLILYLHFLLTMEDHKSKFMYY